LIIPCQSGKESFICNLTEHEFFFPNGFLGEPHHAYFIDDMGIWIEFGLGQNFSESLAERVRPDFQIGFSPSILFNSIQAI
jgi:hypothetical protein